jgi:hypothetical protein
VFCIVGEQYTAIFQTIPNFVVPPRGARVQHYLNFLLSVERAKKNKKSWILYTSLEHVVCEVFLRTVIP